MKTGRTLLFFIAVFFISAAAVHAADLGEGIFGLKWGTQLSELNGFSKIWSRGNVDFYRKPGEVRTINEIDVSEIIYGFYDAKFFALYVKINSLEVFDEFRRYMKSKYGIPQKTLDVKNNLTVYRWKHDTVKIKLKTYDNNNFMKLAFYYTPLSNSLNESRQDNLQNDSFRFLPIEKDKRPERMPLLEF